jgi:hypothetical protein
MKTVKIQATAASVRFDNKALFQGWGWEERITVGTGAVLHVISGSLSPQHGASSGCGWRKGLLYGG